MAGIQELEGPTSFVWAWEDPKVDHFGQYWSTLGKKPTFAGKGYRDFIFLPKSPENRSKTIGICSFLQLISFLDFLHIFTISIAYSIKKGPKLGPPYNFLWMYHTIVGNFWYGSLDFCRVPFWVLAAPFFDRFSKKN